MKDLENFLQAVQDKVGQAKFSERLKEIDNFFINGTPYSSRAPKDPLFFYIAVCTAIARNKGRSYIPIEYARIYPMLFNLNNRWDVTKKIKNFDERFNNLCSQKPSQSVDSILFEILVAIYYAEEGFEVEFIPATDKKSPDLKIYKDGHTKYIECKKMQRANAYTYDELDSWYALSGDLLKIANKYCYDGYIAFRFRQPFSEINLRKIKRYFIRRMQSRNHLKKFRIIDDKSAKITFFPFSSGKLNTIIEQPITKSVPSLINYLTGEFNYRLIYKTLFGGKFSDNSDINLISSAIIFSCQFSYTKALEKKSQHIKRLLTDAAKQISEERPGNIHILVEECHNEYIHRLRCQKNIDVIHNFIDINRGVEYIFVHYIKYITPPDRSFDVEETIQYFRRADKFPVEVPPIWYHSEKYSQGYGTLLIDY